MPANDASIISSATTEWDRWGRSTWNVKTGAKTIGHTDDEMDFATLVIDRYCLVGGGTPTINDIADDRYFWSAVGISAAMKAAGFTKEEFPFAQAHSKFIRHFVAARKASNPQARYWGFRLNEPGGEPQPGDLVAYARSSVVRVKS
jgi:hypothetical protein